MCVFFKQKTAYERRISDWSSDVCSSDLDALLAMARAAQPGMTNLPADPETLAAMLTASVARMTAADGGTGDTAALWFIVWHDGAAIGACAIFPTVGAAWPFYSYRRDRVRTVSQALGRSITLETLAPSNHFDGAADRKSTRLNSSH